MKHHVFAESDNYPIAVLIKHTSFNKQEIASSYLEPLAQRGVASTGVIAFTLGYNEAGKAPAAYIKEYLGKLLPALESLGTKYLYVADSAYFKVLTGQAKAEPHHGYVLPCKIKGYEHVHVVLGINYQARIYNPDLQAKLDLGLKTLASHVAGTYQALGTGIIHSAQYPEGVQAIAAALQSLHQYPRLSSDIEAFSLRFNEAGIGTIGFAWDQHNGIAFACDYAPHDPHSGGAEEPLHGSFKPNQAVRALLLKFFMEYKGEITWHNAAYDVKVLIYTLWMQNLRDTPGLLTGLDAMCQRLHDTKIIAYLATNSTAGNVLGLKALAHEFAGNWAVEDIKDIRKIPLDKVLQYNLVDCLSTNYVKDKYWPIMVADSQKDLYEGLMLDSVRMLIQTELTGLPMSKKRVLEVKEKLEKIRAKHLDTIQNSSVISALNLLLQKSAWEKDFEDRKAKAKNPGKLFPKNIDAFDKTVFNPNSGPQLQRLLYEQMGLPVIDLTDTKQPATGAETIKKLINHTTEASYKELLEALIAQGGVDTILTTFIPAFEQALDANTGDVVWLHGSINLGGTVSGRLSSSNPNLTNIPAKVKVKVGGIYIDLGKLIKYCFISPTGWLFAGADYNSLEDMISALTTKDPNKLKVYTDGFDGHALRAVNYYPEQFAHIDVSDPKQVNTLKKIDHPLRQESKIPTFALTYLGTWHTLVNNLGWEPEKAKRIEANYHKMYVVSDNWVQDKLQQASKDGYVTVAFGLRVRTPLLSQVIFNGPKMPYEAAAEGRTAGNALGQSYCMLTMRSMADFMKKVWASKYRYQILPVALIHDANYLLIKDDAEVVEWANRELIASMQWQELPEIQHPTVKLGAQLDVFWPYWSNTITLPNDITRQEIIDICEKAKLKVAEPA